MNAFTFMIDVDNTLVDNDHVKAYLDSRIDQLVGSERRELFWQLYEQIRDELDFVDFPETLRRFAIQFPREKGFPRMASMILGFPYDKYLFPGTLDALKYLETLGAPVIVSDGDPVFQPAKIARAGLAAAVDDRIMIFVHKEEHMDDVFGTYPAERYVLIDDKPTILTATKKVLGSKVVTVHIRQGKYADAARDEDYDIQLDNFAEITKFSAEDLIARAEAGSYSPSQS